MARQKTSASATSKAEVRAARGPGRGAWKALDTSSALAAAALAPRVASLGWRVVTGRKPPSSTRNPDLSTGEAVAWAAIGGATVQVVRTLIRRGAANYWVKSTGNLPPGMKALDDTKR